MIDVDATAMATAAPPVIATCSAVQAFAVLPGCLTRLIATSPRPQRSRSTPVMIDDLTTAPRPLYQLSKPVQELVQELVRCFCW